MLGEAAGDAAAAAAAAAGSGGGARAADRGLELREAMPAR